MILACGEYDVLDATGEAIGWGFMPETAPKDDDLCDAYIILDFMPDPPELPELCQE